MVKVNIVAVGKVKEKYFAEGISEYKKRLSKYCDITVTEIGEENFTKAEGSVIESIKVREGEKIIPHLKGHVFVMAIEGKKISSEKLAFSIKELSDKGEMITFVIGGSYGLSDDVKKRASSLVSFSDMTFPHTMFRLMLLEQLYRAFSINAGSAYHK